MTRDRRIGPFYKWIFMDYMVIGTVADGGQAEAAVRVGCLMAAETVNLYMPFQAKIILVRFRIFSSFFRSASALVMRPLTSSQSQ